VQATLERIAEVIRAGVAVVALGAEDTPMRDAVRSEHDSQTEKQRQYESDHPIAS
jgi:hypothetical protein